MHKRRYDNMHIDIFVKLIVNNYVYFRFFNNYIISNLNNRKLNQQRIKLFKILIKVDTLIYRFELFSIINIHSIIFIAQLKSTSTSNANFYRRFKSNMKNLSTVQLKNDKKKFEKFNQVT